MLCKCQVKHSSFPCFSSDLRLVGTVDPTEIRTGEFRRQLFLMKCQTSVPAHIKIRMISKSVEQSAVHTVGKDFDISLCLSRAVFLIYLRDPEGRSLVLTDHHTAHRKFNPVRHRPDNRPAVRRQRRPSGIYIWLFNLTVRLVQILRQSIGKLRSGKRSSLIFRKNQTSLRFPLPVSSRRHPPAVPDVRRKNLR